MTHLHHNDIRVRFHRHISPPVPRRNTHLFGEPEHPVDRPTLVAARNDERAVNTLHRMIHHLDHGRLPLTGDPPHIQFSIADKSVDHRTLPDRADDDDDRLSGRDRIQR